ncbi:hypothetical protein TNCV_2708031 [Trichonephila clavipes]|nr:hypothetical protein TNCV_2708031 [Trichonephila clavipes]
MFVRRVGFGGRGVVAYLCVSACLNLKQVVVKVEARNCREGYFSNGRSVIGVQRAIRRDFNIPSRGRVADLKSVSMWMDTFRECLWKMSPRTYKDHPENTERVCVSIQTGM